MRIGFSSDRTGLECKERLLARFAAQGHATDDLSARGFAQSDYESLAVQVASANYTGRCERGVLVCSSAIGASVVANKHPGVRAALCHDMYSTRHGVEDDGMNCLVMGACVVTPDLACELTDAFLDKSGQGSLPTESGDSRTASEPPRKNCWPLPTQDVS